MAHGQIVHVCLPYGRQERTRRSFVDSLGGGRHIVRSENTGTCNQGKKIGVPRITEPQNPTVVRGIQMSDAGDQGMLWSCEIIFFITNGSACLLITNTGDHPTVPRPEGCAIATRRGRTGRTACPLSPAKKMVEVFSVQVPELALFVAVVLGAGLFGE